MHGNKNKKLTEEHKRKIGLANQISLRGQRHSPRTEFKKGQTSWNKGRKSKMSDEQKHKISQTMKGRRPANFGITFAPKGDKHHNWKGGITPAHQKIRTSTEYKLWRESVFKRDNYACIWCGRKSGNGRAVILHADHIKPFALFPELRCAIDNGRTLCKECHYKTDTFAGRTK